MVFPVISACEGSNMPQSITDVKSKHESRILRMPGVVSVGIGRDENGNLAIIVGLSHANPETASRLPDQLDGYPLDVRVVGQIKAQ
jgi:hypothetical protein